MVFRIRELLIRQRTQSINALRGHLVELGEVVPQGAANAPRLIALIEDLGTTLPEMARDILRGLVMTLSQRIYRSPPLTPRSSAVPIKRVILNLCGAEGAFGP